MVSFWVGSGANLYLAGSVVPFHLLLRSVKILSFMISWRMDKGHWPRSLLWHGWPPLLSGVNGASPWAAHASESAGDLLEVALGFYSSGMVSEWSVPEGFDAVGTASRMFDAP